MSERIGIVGLGRMGSALAERLAVQGCAVSGWTRSGVSAGWAEPLGIATHETLGQLAASSDVILLSLFDDMAVQNVLDELLKQDISGKLIVDTSTVSPDLLPRNAAGITFGGAAAIDAPISGGPEMVRAGNCGVFVGGDERDFNRATPVLEHISNRFDHIGHLGAGMTMKVINNGLMQGIWAALIDVVRISKRSGLSLETTLSILEKGPAMNPMLASRIPKILGQDASVGFNMHGAFKDATVFVETARGLGLESPVLAIAHQAWARGLETGQGDQDIAALITMAYEQA